MDEYEKMVAGQWYQANCPGLVAKRQATKGLLFELQQLHPSKAAERTALLKKLFGKTGENLWIELPFACDYGTNISVGESFYANHGCVILDCAPVVIGSGVLLGPQVGIYTAGHPLDAGQRAQGWEQALPITIGDDVWIGGGAVILPGVTIGDHSVIGAGSVVTRSVPADVVAAGNPCKVLRAVTQQDRIPPCELAANR